ncbi:MAG: Sua5/YciO/YrdC/YwlC family protein, partial [Candidatus Omnitrophota bacterium]
MKKVFIDPGDIDIAFIKEIAHILKAGGIVALPTETVYGLAVSSQNPDAVAKLYALKKRPQDKPFTLALADIATVTDKIFAPLPPFGYRLIERFWPGPLTIIYHDRADGKPIG